MLSGVRHGAAETVDGSTTNEAMKLALSVTPLGATRKLGLLKGKQARRVPSGEDVGRGQRVDRSKRQGRLPRGRAPRLTRQR